MGNSTMKERKGQKVVGVDIGGSHISVCVVDLQSAELLAHTFTRKHVNPDGDANEIIGAWVDAISTCLSQTSVDSIRVGIAMPGPFDYEKGISLIKGLHKFETLYGLNVKELLAEKLGIAAQEIKMVNDASAFLLGEVLGGAGKGINNAAGLTLGTGLGSAGFFNGTIGDGDLWCTPFKDSRAEDYLCSRWFVQEYGAISGKKIEGVKELMGLYDEDQSVRLLFDRFGQHLAQVLMMKYPPQVQDMVIIGGNIAKAWNLFIPSAMDHFSAHGVKMNLQPAILGENAAIAGAAFLWKL